MLTYTMAKQPGGIVTLNADLPGRESIEIDLTALYDSKIDVAPIYEHVNQYIAALPIEDQTALYELILETYVREQTTSYSDKSVVRELELRIKRAAEILNYERWKAWFRQFSDTVLVPHDLQEHFIYDPDLGTTREKTYVKSEYVDLIALIIYIRALSPLYVEYYNYMVRGKITKHGAYLVLRLLVESDIYESPEIHKLRQYIEANQQTLVGVTKNEHLIIGAGLCDDDALDYLIAEVIFNKLFVIDFFSKQCNIISFIFQTIKYKGNFASTNNSAITAKSPRGDPDRDDHSYFEDYRKTTSVPIGTVVEIQMALNDPVLLARDLGYHDFDFDLYYRDLENIGPLLKGQIDTIQIYILGWFLGRTINPRALFYLERRKIAELLIFAKTALIHSNHALIGLLLGSVRSPETKYINVVMRNTLKPQLVQNLRRHFRFAMQETRADKKDSVIERTISEICKEIINSIWMPVGETGRFGSLITHEGYLEIPSNINDVMCAYIDYVLGNKDATVVV